MSGTDPVYPGHRDDENDDDLGMDLVDQVSTDAENTRRPLKKWVFVVAGLAVILIGVVILLANLMPKNYVAQVDGAKDKVVVQADLEGGGHAVLSTSAKADAGSVALTALPRIDGTERYTVWLIEAESDRATRLATIDAGAESATEGFNGMATVGSVMLTVEPAEGSTSPSTEPLVVLETPAAK
ncbi:anti-sigma factor domain-containing protein [Paeniglutamicibacter kerguelensis]|uniref:Anti-sigma K factor RskA C-terminal domain-containing protein n=1 Tax=Paeniglutamicibacter kerguelensis TaxID=254788 RepID=A0ABS4XEA2_9MICC|nr:anti-sigma factor [Paeniglutamicibacter kerguelensis]MBP2386701.1 hypothetical protein [Paeniglutamicibacter kerguelensis]